jgi:hypothetical protein
MLKTITERSHPSGLRIEQSGPEQFRKIAPGDPTYQLVEYEFS